MKSGKLAGVMGVIAAMTLWGGNLRAQDDNGGGGPDRNFDPAQFRQQMMERMRQNLGVTNDDEWSAIQPLIRKVMDARREAGDGPGMGMGGPGGPPPGAGFGGGPEGPPPDDGPRGFGPQRSEEQKALQKVIDGNPTKAQIKEALAKYRSIRSEKKARLEAAQADLRAVLTVKQEATAVLMGLLQ